MEKCLLQKQSCSKVKTPVSSSYCYPHNTNQLFGRDSFLSINNEICNENWESLFKN